MWHSYKNPAVSQSKQHLHISVQSAVLSHRSVRWAEGSAAPRPAKGKNTKCQHTGSLRPQQPSAHLLVTVVPRLSDSSPTASCLCRSLWREPSRSADDSGGVAVDGGFQQKLKNCICTHIWPQPHRRRREIPFSTGQTCHFTALFPNSPQDKMFTPYQLMVGGANSQKPPLSGHKRQPEKAQQVHTLLCQHKQSQVCASALSAVAVQRCGALPAVSSE